MSRVSYRTGSNAWRAALEQLWASHADFVNDISELRYVDGLVEELTAELASSFDAALVRSYLDAVPDAFKRVFVRQL